MTSTTPQQPEGPIRQAWKQFWIAIFEPWTIVLLVSTLVLFAITQAKITGAANTLAQVLLAASSGVLGGRIANRISAIAGEGVLIARGKVSVRSLKLLYQYASSLEARVARFLKEKDTLEGNAIATERGLQEVVAGCRHIQEHALTSIDNWTDVVPGAADISVSIGAVSAAKAEADQAQLDLAALQARLETAQAERDTTADQLLREVDVARNELASVQVKLRNANSRLALADALTTSQNATKLGTITLGEIFREAESKPIFQSRLGELAGIMGAKPLSGVGLLGDAPDLVGSKKTPSL